MIPCGCNTVGMHGCKRPSYSSLGLAARSPTKKRDFLRLPAKMYGSKRPTEQACEGSVDLPPRIGTRQKKTLPFAIFSHTLHAERVRCPAGCTFRLVVCNARTSWLEGIAAGLSYEQQYFGIFDMSCTASDFYGFSL